MSAAAAAPLRVLHVAAGNLYGGVESQLKALADCRDGAPGLSMEFAVCFEGRLSEILRAAGAAVHMLGDVRYSRPWTAWRARRRLARLIARGGFEVVVAHAGWPYWLAAPAVRRKGRSLVFWAHDHLGGGHWIERAAGRTAPDLVIANSLGTAATVPGLFPGAPTEVVYNVVPAPPFDRAAARAEVRAGFDVPAGAVVVVTACRLERWKGHALLLDALGRLRDKPGWTCWIIGGAQRPHEREYLAELVARADAAGVGDRVRFLGQRDDVPRLLAAADVHCQPNTSPEPFGIAFVEALNASLPVVSTRLGGAEEIVTDRCGRLVPPGNLAALAVVLSELIDDPEARLRLGSAGPARAAALCAPAVVLPRLSAVLHGLTTAPVVAS